MPTGASPKTSGPDVIKAMSTDLWLDFMGVRLDVAKAAGKHFTVNLITPDNDEKYIVELNNSALTNIKGITADKADLSITINRTDLNEIMMGVKSFDEQIEAGKAKLQGDHKALDELKTMLSTFTIEFELLPGTLEKKAEQSACETPFKQDAPADSAGG